MMKKLNWIWGGCLGMIIFVSCQSERTKDGITQEILADMICECSAKIVRHNQLLASLMHINDKVQLEEEIKKGEGIFNEATTCITTPIQNDISAILTPDLWEKVKSNCQLDERVTADLILRIDEFNQSQEW